MRTSSERRAPANRLSASRSRSLASIRPAPARRAPSTTPAEQRGVSTPPPVLAYSGRAVRSIPFAEEGDVRYGAARSRGQWRAVRRRRRRRRRRGVRGTLHALPPARARVLRAGLRGGRRGRGHLVLEPIPGRPLRRREHGLLVLVLGRAPAGVAVDRALRLAAGDPALRQPRGRPVRPAPRRAVQDAGD